MFNFGRKVTTTPVEGDHNNNNSGNITTYQKVCIRAVQRTLPVFGALRHAHKLTRRIKYFLFGGGQRVGSRPEQLDAQFVFQYLVGAAHR